MDKSGAVYIIRRSFTLLILRIIAVELLLECIYVIWRLGIDYLPVDTAMKIGLHGLTTAVFMVVTIMQIIFLIVTVSRWLNEYYELQEDEIIQWTGVLTKKGKSYPYTNIQSITVQQGWFGRLLKYGTVNLYVPALGHDLVFSEVPEPYAFIELVKQYMPKGNDSRFLFRRR